MSGLHFAARVDARNFDVAFDLGPGERLAVLGPNGAGKSTLLGLIAGTLTPDAGRAELDGHVLFELDRTPRRSVPPHARRVALLAQDPLLFPHLSVLDNVAFGPRAARRSRAEARKVARAWLDQVDAGHLADRKPGQLSGGQAQRVAVARAAAADPQLLLLDEPLAALDVTAAPLLRRTLRSVLTDRTVIVVTHEALDAVLLSDRVIVLDQGRIVESGSTTEVLRHPTNPFTARLAGLNIITGTATAGDPAQLRSTTGALVDGIARAPLAAGEPAAAVFPPHAVSVHLEVQGGSPRNHFAVAITELEPRSDRVAVRAAGPSGMTLTADVTAAAVGELDLYPGRTVHYSVKATAVTIYPT